MFDSMNLHDVKSIEAKETHKETRDRDKTVYYVKSIVITKADNSELTITCFSEDNKTFIVKT